MVRSPFFSCRFVSKPTISLFLLVLTFSALAGASEEVIYRFQGGTDGYFPTGTLLKDDAGNLYGSTAEGGTPGLCDGYGCGTVFELTPPAQAGDPWVESVLYRFQGDNDGSDPNSPLVADRQGNLYGSTATGGDLGNGTIFELERPSAPGGSWIHKVLHSFKGVPSGTGTGDGALPSAVRFDAAGNLYGTTDQGGLCVTSDDITTCFGSVFRLAPPSHLGGTWTESVLYRFGLTGLNDPHGGVIFDRQGNLYGTTYTGGVPPYFLGGVFELSPPGSGGETWQETTLFEFALTDGGAPNGSLIFDAAGNLYGTTLIGGTSGYGTAFELSPPESGIGSWRETILYDFLTDGDGNSPLAELIFDKTGNLYGTDWMGGLSNRGSVFQLTPPSSPDGTWSEVTLHTFGSGNDGSEPRSGLIFGAGGALYGTASQGGSSRDTNNCKLDGYAWTCGIVFAVQP